MGVEGFVAHFVFDRAVPVELLKPAPDLELIVELVAGELEFLATVFVLDEADEDPGWEEAVEGVEAGDWGKVGSGMLINVLFIH